MARRRPRAARGAPRSVDGDQERTRGRIALSLIVLAAGVAVAAFGTLRLAPASVDRMIRLLELLFSPVVGLLGIAVAFYYGARASPSR